jgi:16S rRNA processing protein RimM
MGGGSSWRSSTTQSDRRLAIARVLGAKGLKGGIRVELLTDFPARLAPGSEVWLEGSTSPIRIERVESGGRTTVLYLEGIAGREAAEQLTDRYIEAPAHELGEGEFYWNDLVGLRVEEPGGATVGELIEVFRAGGNEVYRIVGSSGERLVPALRSAVLRIDLDAGLMVVAPDEAEEVR